MSALGLFVNVELVEIEIKSKLSDDGRNVQYTQVTANARVTFLDVGFALGKKLFLGDKLLVGNELRYRKRISRDHIVVAVSEIGFDHRERLVFDYLAHFFLLKAFSMPGPLLRLCIIKPGAYSLRHACGNSSTPAESLSRSVLSILRCR